LARVRAAARVRAGQECSRPDPRRRVRRRRRDREPLARRQGGAQAAAGTADRRAVKLSDPAHVAAEYASEPRLEGRRAGTRDAEGPDARELTFEAVAEAAPKRVLEVGPGPGELSARIRNELGAEVVAVDISERMVELARARGIDAIVGDV